MLYKKTNDADAAEAADQPKAPETLLTTEQLKDVLREVIDPEIGVNIVDLGLIYDVKQKEDGNVDVLMTLTTPGCPYGPQLLQEVEYMLKNTTGVNDVDIEITWDPPWTMDFVSEETRLDMGFDF